jgi:hypothetical protein
MTKEQKIEYKKQYYLANKERILERTRLNYLKNKDKIVERHKHYYDINKETINKGRYNYKKELFNKNPGAKIAHNLRIRLRKLLKTSPNYNKSYTNLYSVLGCNRDTLKGYLEIRFQEGMSWENYGKWHIDHIRPCVSFDLSLPEQQAECFHYTNLQPLWAQDNLKKHGKISLV